MNEDPGEVVDDAILEIDRKIKHAFDGFLTSEIPEKFLELLEQLKAKEFEANLKGK